MELFFFGKKSDKNMMKIILKFLFGTKTGTPKYHTLQHT